ncbi:MAG TPA: hypothetical protein VHP14_24410 [Anaerolineales bacterium]|nr:hypothetical protein [Anaerolineales bacterium]
MKVDDYDSSGFSWSPTNIMGGFLVIMGVGVLIWVVVSLFQLFTSTSSFLVLDKIIPKQMVISQGTNGAKLLLPREILIFGSPVWALGAASRIGLTMMRSGMEYVEKPRRKA